MELIGPVDEIWSLPEMETCDSLDCKRSAKLYKLSPKPNSQHLSEPVTDWHQMLIISSLKNSTQLL
jgi:hypothetical protein